MNYYGAYLIYLLASLAVSVLFFVWAVGRGQFRDQARAGTLALEGVSPVPVDAATRRWPASMILVTAIAGALLLGTIALVAVAAAV